MGWIHDLLNFMREMSDWLIWDILIAVFLAALVVLDFWVGCYRHGWDQAFQASFSSSWAAFAVMHVLSPVSAMVWIQVVKAVFAGMFKKSQPSTSGDDQ